MYLKSLEGSRLRIGSYPQFIYNASGGGGEGTIIQKINNNSYYVNFTTNEFSIPSLSWRSTKILNIPLPPGIEIKMSLEKLDGTIDQDTKQISLDFESKFNLSILTIFKFPSLNVKTTLSTGEIITSLYEEKGLPLQENGETTLVGKAIIPPTTNKLLNIFLDLPNEALAILKCEIEF
tara:strand:+ start:1647 stop:2180 length:534 start_codon:yes stop_codon:yes gene_type:complete